MPFRMSWRAVAWVIVLGLTAMVARPQMAPAQPPPVQQQTVQQPPAQQQPNPAPQSSTATDPAYLNGYRAGYQAGAHDRAAKKAFNFHKFLAYQEAISGFQPNDGSRAEYQAGFRSGFADGYNDAYQNRPQSIGATPAATTPAAATGSANTVAGFGPTPAPGPRTPSETQLTPQQRRARAIGYREGYSAGQYDADRGAADNVQHSHEYQQASAGYTSDLGNFAAFQQEFRAGFVTGYDDGYHHRLYNSSIGLRPKQDAAAAPIQNNSLQLSAGTFVHALLDNYISTKSSHQGDTFSATVNVPVYATNGQIAIPAGSRIEGVIRRVHRGGFLGGKAKLTLDYQRIMIPGNRTYMFSAVTTGVGRQTDVRTNGEGGVTQANKKGTDERKIGVASGTGAVLGGIFGGGILRGAIAGAIVGTGGVIAGRNRDIRLYTGEHIEMQLNKPLALVPITAGA